MSGRFTKWSWSALQVYRTCHLWAKFKYIDRLPEPPIPQDDKRNRGVHRHKLAEDFIGADETPLPSELIKFDGPLNDVRNIRKHNLGVVELEKELYFDAFWKPTNKDSRWLVVIPDIKITIPGELSLVIDEKTGKKYGNEMKHFGQCELYSITSWLLDPGHSAYESELWYLDLGEVWPITFTAPKLERAHVKIDAEVASMMEDKFFRPSPSKHNCKFCPYSPSGTGACPVGVH